MERAKASSPFGSSFIDENAGGPGVRVRTRDQKKSWSAGMPALSRRDDAQPEKPYPIAQPAGAPRRLLVARKRILAQHPLKRR
jgi:hypothetical protein